MKRRTALFALTFLLSAGCKPPPPQAVVETDPVNNETANAAVNAIFGTSAVNNVDSDNDGTPDSSIDVVALLAGDLDADALCAAAANPAFPDNVDDIVAVGVFVLRLNPGVVTAPGFKAGDEVLSDTADPVAPSAVASAMIVRRAGVDIVNAPDDLENDSLGELTIGEISAEALSATITDTLLLDISGQALFDVDTNGDNVPDATAINAAVSAELSGAARCANLDNIFGN
jgi:hypothetical protein